MQPTEVIRLRFIPMLTSRRICSDSERKLIALPIKFGGFGLLDYCKTRNFEYQNSKELTKGVTENIILQNKIFQINNLKKKQVEIRQNYHLPKENKWCNR